MFVKASSFVICTNRSRTCMFGNHPFMLIVPTTYTSEECFLKKNIGMKILFEYISILSSLFILYCWCVIVKLSAQKV